MQTIIFSSLLSCLSYPIQCSVVEVVANVSPSVAGDEVGHVESVLADVLAILSQLVVTLGHKSLGTDTHRQVQGEHRHEEEVVEGFGGSVGEVLVGLEAREDVSESASEEHFYLILINSHLSTINS